MEKEEEEIRSLFDEMQKPIKEDPTLVRKLFPHKVQVKDNIMKKWLHTNPLQLMSR